MQVSALQQSLGHYQRWKRRVVQALQELERWLSDHRRSTPRARERIEASLDLLRRDRVTVAVVGESSRGKLELTDALFFPDLGGRLLPADDGDGPQCPTELLWDDQRDEAYLRLLPVESRAQGESLAELRGDPGRWIHYPLNVEAPEQLAGTLGTIRQTKVVSRTEASRLGFADEGLPPERQAAAGGIEIPRWRYAVVSLPHPLLRQGLVVLVGPGARALAQEAELTDTLIPGAQAVLLVLPADDAVARGDLELWKPHLSGFEGECRGSLLVALGNVDLLWDRLRDADAIDGALGSLRTTVADLLGLDPEGVLPVSAQKGLIARARKDDALLRRSGLPELERQLGQRLLASKQALLVDTIDAQVGRELAGNRTYLGARVARFQAEIEDLETLLEKSKAATAQLLERTRREQALYLGAVEQFQRSRERLLAETRLCRQSLEAETIEAIIGGTWKRLRRCWTSVGLSRSMRALFEQMRGTMQMVSAESERLRRLVRQIYQTYRDEYGFDAATPKVFIPMKYSVETELLLQEVDAYRRSPAMVLARPGRVIRRFEQEMVSRARVLFEQLRIACDGWIREALEPLAHEIALHQAAMEKRLESLRKIERSKDDLQARIDQMRRQHLIHAQELTTLRNIDNALHHDPLGEQEARHAPRRASG
jgi:hypothetical protein